MPTKPPPIPQAARKPVDTSSPWDEQVVASVPAPTPHKAAGLTPPAWLGRPITHKDHAHELEMDAALNEFGPSRLPRSHAEEKAYQEYTKRQHTEAAAHHLAGMRAAHAAGDMESARKHSVMYGVHSKALGHDPVGPAHPSVAAHLQGNPGQVRFKPHRGDLFAIQKPPAVISSSPAPELGKTLHKLWEGLQALQKGDAVSDLNKWAKTELAAKKRAKQRPCVCSAYSHPHRPGGGKCGAK